MFKLNKNLHPELKIFAENCLKDYPDSQLYNAEVIDADTVRVYFQQEEENKVRLFGFKVLTKSGQQIIVRK